MTIFEFDDYKLYLRGWMRSRPHRGRGEVLRLAKAIGVHSTLVSQVLNGPKDFTLEQTQALGEHLGLIATESEYLMNLVQRERAGTPKLKKHFAGQLEKLKTQSLELSQRVKRDRVLSDLESARFYSDWIYSAVGLQTSVKGFDSIEKLAEHFGLPRAKMAEMVQFLLSAGLLHDHDGRLEMGAQRTHLESGSPFLKQHHVNWRLRSMQKASGLSADELMFTAPMSLSRKDFLKLREQLVGLIQSVFELAKDSEAETLACLNIDWIRI
jgi:uncharacterized protein (TIGR02147 family)